MAFILTFIADQGPLNDQGPFSFLIHYVDIIIFAFVSLRDCKAMWE